MMNTINANAEILINNRSIQMPWSGSSPNKTFTRSTGTYSGATAWAQEDAAGTGVVASKFDTHDQDLATGINTCLAKDGGNSPTANINWGGYKITNLADPTSDQDVATKAYVDTAAAAVTVSDGDKGDITVASSGTVWTIDDGAVDAAALASDAVTTAKILDGNVTTAKIADVNVTTGKIADDAVTLAKMASGTAGNLITYDASGNPVAVSTGSSGQVLTSNGAGAAPTFQDASGGMEFIGNAYAQSNTFPSVAIPAGYAKLMIHFTAKNSAGSSRSVDVRLSDNDGASYTGFDLANSMAAGQISEGLVFLDLAAETGYVMSSSVADNISFSALGTINRVQLDASGNVVDLWMVVFGVPS